MLAMRRPVHPLLQNIRHAVRQAGGTRMLAYLIMSENRALYSDREIQDMKNKAWGTLRNRKHAVQQPKKENDFWSESDVRYLMKHYAKMKSRQLAAILNRTVVACRDKFYRHATPEQRQAVKRHGRYAGRINNFKPKNI